MTPMFITTLNSHISCKKLLSFIFVVCCEQDEFVLDHAFSKHPRQTLVNVGECKDDDDESDDSGPGS